MILQQSIYSWFCPEKRKTRSALSEIDQLYLHIYEKGELYGEWYFGKNHYHQYWKYLHHYTWLSKTEQDNLITGSLNIILFLAHDCIQGKGTIIQKNIIEIINAVNNYHPETARQKQLWFMVKEALILCEKRISGMQNNNKENAIYNSISWTLKNTILNKENPPIKIKNQR